jgi:hypothetical protein
MKGELIFKILAEILSYQWTFFGFKDLIMFSIPILEVGLNLISGKGIVKVWVSVIICAGAKKPSYATVQNAD